MVESRQGFDAYQLYIALKLHFTSDYDFIKYNGKVKSATFDSYLKRKDKYHFAKVGKKYKSELKDFFISNFIHEDVWVGDMLGKECESNYKHYKKYIQSLSYSFERDCENLEALSESLDSLFLCDDSSHPIICRAVLSRTISPITYGLIESRLHFSSKLPIKEEYVWPEFKNRMLKMIPFLPYDSKKISEIMINVWQK